MKPGRLKSSLVYFGLLEDEAERQRLIATSMTAQRWLAFAVATIIGLLIAVVVLALIVGHFLGGTTSSVSLRASNSSCSSADGDNAAPSDPDPALTPSRRSTIAVVRVLPGLLTGLAVALAYTSPAFAVTDVRRPAYAAYCRDEYTGNHRGGPS